MANYVLIERITVGSAGASSVTFNNIPQTGYTDLKVVVSAKGTDSAARGMLIAFNGSSSTFSGKYLIGDGSSPSSGSLAQYVGSIFGTGGTANTFNNTEIYIPNYLGSQQKSFSVDNVAENNGSTGYANIIAGLWATTSAISSINLSIQVGSFIQYSTFSLYALAAVGTTPTKAPKAIGGDIIQTDGTYWYHAFLSSGSFTPQTALSCDVLVVAGGGGGGGYFGGGGGAGGLRLLTAQSFASNTTQLVTIGAGGTGSAGSGNASNGGNSSFGSISADGGGGGNSGNTAAPANGGSGGGAGPSYSGGSGNTGSYTPVEGYAGGVGTGGLYITTGGGGGGAGGTGGNGVGSSGGHAGNGGVGAGGTGYTNYAILDAMGAATTTGVLSSSHYYYAGGGGGGGDGRAYLLPGGTGGTGGGGAGDVTSSAQAGTANTGGGGGANGMNSSGSYAGTPGANGGSGLVIIRYAY